MDKPKKEKKDKSNKPHGLPDAELAKVRHGRIC